MSKNIVFEKRHIIVIIFYALLVSFFVYLSTASYISLPSPIYGGDYYYQAGSVEHISNGGNVLKSSSLLEGIPGYAPLYGIFVSAIKVMLGLSAFQAMFIAGSIIIFLSIIVHYLLFSEITDNKMLSVLLTVFFISPLLILKYTPFTAKLIIPLLVLGLVRCYKDFNKLNAIILGLSWGLLSWSHTIAFAVSSILLGIVFISQNRELNIKKYYEKVLRYKYQISLFLLTSLPLIVAIWFRPVFVFMLHRPYDRIHMDFMDLGRISLQFKFMGDFFKSYFFNFNSIKNAAISLISIFGAGILVLNKSKKFKIMKLLAGSFLVIIFSYIITENIIGINFSPHYQMTFWGLSLFVVPLIYSAFVFARKHVDKKAIYLFMIIGILFFSIFNIYSFTSQEKDQWQKSGENDLPIMFTRVRDFITKNTDINDVILTTKESGFALNALTGRKLVVNRWAQQNDPFTDIPQRDVDAAIILYGNNTDIKKELIEKYQIKYLYWDYSWIQNEYRFNEKNELTSWFDPLITYQTPQNEKQLKDNGVDYFIQNTWVDPTSKRDEIRTFDLLFISPKNYHNVTHPWNPNIDKYLTEVWSYKQGDQKISVMYKVNTN